MLNIKIIFHQNKCNFVQNCTLNLILQAVPYFKVSVNFDLTQAQLFEVHGQD